ncbi:MAG: zinc ribbon domain-containing protein [Parcubacteria group bacterium]|nr:zinc ribbon domain-containing protein [Parcubacteria group bacterium]
MYCSKCGEQLKEKDNFCPNCGKEIEKQRLEEITLLPMMDTHPQVPPGSDRLKERKDTQETIIVATVIILIVAGIVFGMFKIVDPPPLDSICNQKEGNTAFTFRGADVDDYCLIILPYEARDQESPGVWSAILNKQKNLDFKKSFEIDPIANKVKFIADGYSEVITPQVWVELRQKIEGEDTELQPPFTTTLTNSNTTTKLVLAPTTSNDIKEITRIVNGYISELPSSDTLQFETKAENGSTLTLELKRSYPIFRMAKERDDSRKTEVLYITTVKEHTCDIKNNDKFSCTWHETDVLQNTFKDWFTQQKLYLDPSVENLSSMKESDDKVVIVTAGTMTGLPKTYGWKNTYQIESDSYAKFLQDCGAYFQQQNNNNSAQQRKYITEHQEIDSEIAQEEARVKYPLYNISLVCPQRYISDIGATFNAVISSNACIKLFKNEDEDESFAQIKRSIYLNHLCR